MALDENLKTALDETRTLILGAQILLGFQYQGAFQDQFDALSLQERTIAACALGLVLTSVALLIAPSAFHRIAEQGMTTGRVKSLAGRCAAAALLPFAIALGFDFRIALERAFGSSRAGVGAAVGFGLLASFAWYGVSELMKRNLGAAEREKATCERTLHETPALHLQIEQMLTEARVILPGAQALLGFQLAIVLTGAFEKLPDVSRLLHGVALLNVALSIILLITPAAIHRIVWAGEDNEALLRIGGWLAIAALLPLALGMAGDLYVVLERIFHSARAASASALVTLFGLLGLWFGWPLTLRRQRGGASGTIQVSRR